MFKKLKLYKLLIAEFVTIFGAVASFSMALISDVWPARGFFLLYLIFLSVIGFIHEGDKQ